MKYCFLFFMTFVLTNLSAQTIDSIANNQVDSLIQVTRTLTGKRDFEKALETNAVAEKLALEKLGRESAAYGSCAFNRGRVNDLKGDYSEAEKWYLEAKSIREIVLGKENADYTKCIYTMANLYLTFGYYEKSEPLFIEVLAIGERVFGRQHLEVARYISGLAKLYYAKGDYGSAEELMLESKLIHENISGKDDNSYAESLFSLGNLNLSIGNYKKAENYHLEVKEIHERKFGKESTSYCSSLVNLANIFYNMGNYEKSELYFLEAKNIFELKLKIRLNPFYVNCLGNLGRLYNTTNKYSEAELLLLEVKKIFELELNNRTHPYYTTSLRVLADVYNNMEDFEKAEALYLEAKAIFEKTLGSANREYGQCLHKLAKFYEKSGRISMSEPLLVEVNNLEVEQFTKVTSFLSEQELAKFTKNFQSNGNNLSAYLLHRFSINSQSGVLPELCYDFTLFQKGFLLTSASRLNSLAVGSPDAEELNNNLKAYRRRLAAELTKPISERKNIEELEENANVLGKELARTVAGYAESLQQVKYQDVKAGLKQSEAAIEFIHFQVDFPLSTDSTMYAALLILPGAEQPKFIPLFEEKEFNHLLDADKERRSDYVNDLYAWADRGMIKLGSEKKSLYDLIWAKIEATGLKGIKTVYYSPSGVLHRINLGAIAVNDETILSDRYNLVSMNSTRQLVIPASLSVQTNNALLVGGVNFEADSIYSKVEDEAVLAIRSTAEAWTESGTRGGTWSYLKWTEREIDNISITLTTGGYNTIKYTGSDATEEAIKSIGIKGSSLRILHLSTHGFFFPDPVHKTASSPEDVSVFKWSDNPMIRSGLILAGGNYAWQHGRPVSPDKEDGILTAYEISQMNLSNTELVVLSACETGLGDIQGNEGVYGLQRAFKIAGAKYLIMSLWQVPDQETMVFMTTFYKNWLPSDAEALAGKEGKMTIPDAFRKTQREMRDRFINPYSWAAFVLVE